MIPAKVQPTKAVAWQVGDDRRLKSPVLIRAYDQPDGTTRFAVERNSRTLGDDGRWTRNPEHRFHDWDEAAYAADRAFCDLVETLDRAERA